MHCTWLFHAAGNLNSCPHACTAGTFSSLCTRVFNVSEVQLTPLLFYTYTLIAKTFAKAKVRSMYTNARFWEFCISGNCKDVWCCTAQEKHMKWFVQSWDLSFSRLHGIVKRKQGIMVTSSCSSSSRGVWFILVNHRSSTSFMWSNKYKGHIFPRYIK